MYAPTVQGKFSTATKLFGSIWSAYRQQAETSGQVSRRSQNLKLAGESLYASVEQVHNTVRCRYYSILESLSPNKWLDGWIQTWMC